MKANIVTHLLVIWVMNLSLSFAADGFTQETGDIFGTVYRKGSGSRISSAQVRLHGLNQAAVTDSAGEFRFENLPPGDYTLNVSAEGYVVKDGITATVVSGEATTVGLYLETIPFTLPEVPVTAERLPATVSRENMEVHEIKQMPGTAGDALRSLPTLPGIGVANDLDGSLHIRGGGPDDNVFYFDRLPIGYPYHFGDSFQLSVPRSSKESTFMRVVSVRSLARTLRQLLTSIRAAVIGSDWPESSTSTCCIPREWWKDHWESVVRGMLQPDEVTWTCWYRCLSILMRMKKWNWDRIWHYRVFGTIRHV